MAREILSLQGLPLLNPIPYPIHREKKSKKGGMEKNDTIIQSPYLMKVNKLRQDDINDIYLLCQEVLLNNEEGHGKNEKGFLKITKKISSLRNNLQWHSMTAKARRNKIKSLLIIVTRVLEGIFYKYLPPICVKLQSR